MRDLRMQWSHGLQSRVWSGLASFYIILCNLFALHLFSPLTTCVLLKQNQTQKRTQKFSKFYNPKQNKTTSLPSFIFGVTDTSLESNKYGRCHQKNWELVSTFGDFTSNSSMGKSINSVFGTIVNGWYIGLNSRTKMIVHPRGDHTPLRFITTCDKNSLPYSIWHR